MSGTTYLVTIDLQTKGNLAAGVDKVGTSAKGAQVVVAKLNHGFAEASRGAGRLYDMFDGVVSRVADVGIGLAKWGGIAAAGAVTYGVLHLNNELEQTKIALGAIFQANGVAADLPTGMKLAQDTIAKMRVDAQKLPGEFSDLRNIFTTIAIPGFQSGASTDKLRDIAGKLMAFSKVAQVPIDQAAREAAQLLEGRAGAHNVLGMKLAGLAGDKAKEFNQQDITKRFGDVEKYLNKYKDSVEAFGKSWDGISSTTIDLGKQWITLATAPLFEKAKDSLSHINQFFGGNKKTVTEWADHIGWELGHAYDVALVKIDEWWPAIKKFTNNAYTRFVSIWEDVQPYVDRFGSALQDALKDPGTIDKLLLIAKLWAGGKAIGLGADIAGGAAPIMRYIGAGWGLGGAANAAGAVAGGGGLLRGAGSAIGAVGRGIGNTREAASILGWGPALAGGAEAATAALLPLAPAAIAVGAAFAAYETYQWLQTAKLDAAASLELDRQRSLGSVEFERISTLGQMMAAEQSATDKLYDFMSALDIDRLRSAQSGQSIADDHINPYFLALAQQGAGNATAERQKARSPAHPGGGGGTHIQKIEITVSGNDEPNRVAALVVDKLNKMTRHRRTSPDVPSYSSSRG